MGYFVKDYHKRNVVAPMTQDLKLIPDKIKETAAVTILMFYSNVNIYETSIYALRFHSVLKAIFLIIQSTCAK